MNSSLYEQAVKLSKQRYTTLIIRDETTDGEPILVFSHPELPGCMAQGETYQEAQANLEDARQEYILSLLEDDLPVPSPSQTTTISYTTGNIYLGINMGNFLLAHSEKAESISQIQPYPEIDTQSVGLLSA